MKRDKRFTVPCRGRKVNRRSDGRLMTIVLEKAHRNTVLTSTYVVRVKMQTVNLGGHDNNWKLL